VGLLVLGASVGCKQEPTAQPVYYPTPVTGNPAAPGGVPSPSPSPPSAPAMPPAFGFLCATEQDPQCPYGHCAGGRCGGCSSAADCKAGAQCVPSFFGQVCLPGSATAPAPTAAPVPQPQPQPQPAPGAAGTPLERARQSCVQRTNEYRARVGVAPVARRPDTETCLDAQARSDGISRTAHGAFGQCRERAQNECPGWDGDPETVVDRCLAMMFAEGPGAGPAHGHYVNLTEPKYAGVSCGFATATNGQLWVVQDFY
ncbi:MAG TPA: CAP domain-containing protein, partial [Polyangiaceae bacterium]|nr:CAP domain-containing protein [Polyangiaceae bacterium]